MNEPYLVYGGIFFTTNEITQVFDKNMQEIPTSNLKSSMVELFIKLMAYVFIVPVHNVYWGSLHLWKNAQCRF